MNALLDPGTLADLARQIADQIAAADEELWRIEMVESRVGLSRSSIYAMIETGCFPRPRRLGERAVAWRRSDVLRWIRERPEAEPADLTPKRLTPARAADGQPRRRPGRPRKTPAPEHIPA